MQSPDPVRMGGQCNLQLPTFEICRGDLRFAWAIPTFDEFHRYRVSACKFSQPDKIGMSNRTSRFLQSRTRFRINPNSFFFTGASILPSERLDDEGLPSGVSGLPIL